MDMLNGPIDKRTRPLVARKSEEHRIQAIIGRTWSARNKDTSIHLQKRTNKRRLWYYLLFCRLYSTCIIQNKNKHCTSLCRQISYLFDGGAEDAGCCCNYALYQAQIWWQRIADRLLGARAFSAIGTFALDAVWLLKISHGLSNLK